MSAPYISSSLGVNTLTSPCFSKQTCTGCTDYQCVAFQNVSARLGVFQIVQQSDPGYANYSNTIYQNDSCGNVISFSTISSRGGVFSNVLLTNNYQDYVNTVAAVDENGVPNLYDTFVSQFAAFSSITIAPSNYTSYSTICRLYTPTQTGCVNPCYPQDTFLSPYSFNQATISTTIGSDSVNPTLLAGFPFTTTDSGILLVVSSMDFVNTDVVNGYTLNIYVSINDELPTPSVVTITPNSTQRVKLSQKTAASLASGTYAIRVFAFLTTSSSSVQCTNVSNMVMGGFYSESLVPLSPSVA